MKIVKALLVACLVTVGTVSMTVPSPAADYRWQMQSLWQAGSINQTIFEEFCANLSELSGGRIEIEPLPVGAVVAYHETLEAVGIGILDAQHGGAGYFAGKDAGFALLGDLNGAYETPAQMQMWFEYGGGKALARELYAQHNLYFVGGVWWGMESIPAKQPLPTLDSLAGVKIRTPEGMSQEIFKQIGAAPVNIPGAEVYTALERGVVDATDWGTLGMNADLGYHKIAPYPLYPGFHSMPMADVAVNLDSWNALPEDLQKIVELAVRDFSNAMVNQIWLQDTQEARRAAESGVTLVDWSADERRRFRDVAKGVWQDYASRSPMAQKIYDSHIAFLKQIGLLDD